jgi:hypothetical protein
LSDTKTSGVVVEIVVHLTQDEAKALRFWADEEKSPLEPFMRRAMFATVRARELYAQALLRRGNKKGLRIAQRAVKILGHSAEAWALKEAGR